MKRAEQKILRGWHMNCCFGFKQIRLRIVLDPDVTPDERARVMELTERYCVVCQTLRRGSRMSMKIEAAGNPA
jgi:uncharacterized OsmC-like protein